jgi:hypothetical protein
VASIAGLSVTVTNPSAHTNGGVDITWNGGAYEPATRRKMDILLRQTAVDID